MTDKETIHKVLSSLRKNNDTVGKMCYNQALQDAKTAFDSLQEEPVSIWHDSNEEQPNFASTVAIWNPKYKNGEILSRCTEVYSDRIWAYIDDLLKL